MKTSNTFHAVPLALAALAQFALIGGCSRAKSPESLAADVTAAQQAASKQVNDARAEASKGIKSAIKLKGGPSAVARARAIGDFDIAMAQADGEHIVALKQCRLQPEAAQTQCKTQADATYDNATSAAKEMRETRVARR